MLYKIIPIAKPRLTHQGRFKPIAKRYYAFKDRCRLLKMVVPEYGAKITFLIPMAKSWTKKKKEALCGTPHQQAPDLSNLLKALEDACMDDDSRIWHYSDVKKIWAKEGGIVIE